MTNEHGDELVRRIIETLKHCMREENCMPHDPERAGNPKHWVENALVDLVMAQIPILKGASYEHLCFRGQRTVEKSVKVVLLALHVDFPPPHNIQILIDLLLPEIKAISVRKDAGDLARYAAVTRYPNKFKPVNEEEYRRMLRISDTLVA